MSSSLISSRSNSGSTSSSLRPVKCWAPIVARSLPEPLTHMTGTSRPVWSTAVPLADVLPPPKFDTARLAPSRFEASTSCPRVSSGTSPGQRSSTGSISLAMVLMFRGSAPRGDGVGVTFGGHALGVAGRAQIRDGVGGGAEVGARLGAQRADVGAVGLLQVDDAQDHRLDLGLDVVGLVDRQARQAGGGGGQLAEDQEELERVDRPDDQVVVGVLAVVEVKAAEPPLLVEQGDDLLDVHPVRVVAEVDEDAG